MIKIKGTLKGAASVEEEPKALVKKRQKKPQKLMQTGECPELEELMGSPPVDEAPPSVIGLIDSVLLEKTTEMHYLAPSGMFKCPRAAVFQYWGANRGRAPTPPRFTRIVDEGSAVHSVLQRYLSDLRFDYWFIPETKNHVVIDDVNISGSCDGVLVRRSDGYRWGIEIKTKSVRSFEEAKASERPESADKKQALVYAVSQGLWWMTIIYWNKNTQELLEFNVQVSPQFYEKFKERVRYLKPFVLDDTHTHLPEFDKGKCSTMFCKFVDECKRRGGNPDIKDPADGDGGWY